MTLVRKNANDVGTGPPSITHLPTGPEDDVARVSSEPDEIAQGVHPHDARGQQQQQQQQQQEDWEDCSLCSITEQSKSDPDAVERLPIPGRESHTGDIDQYRRFLQKIKAMQRSQVDTPFHEGFWSFFESVLEKAVPVGYNDDGQDTVQEGQEKGIAQHDTDSKRDEQSNGSECEPSSLGNGTEVYNTKPIIPKGPKDNDAFITKVSAISILNPIHPVQLASASGIPIRTVLTELLLATRVGMMSMKMTPNCQRCGSSACTIGSVKDINKNNPKAFYCEGCRYKNYVDCLTKIKVVFVVNMDVLYVLAESFACKPSQRSMAANKVFAMVPATFSGTGLRYSLGCGGDKMLREALPAARYRMHCPVSRTDNYLIVERNANEQDEPVQVKLHVSDIVCRKPTDQRKTIRSPHGKIHLDIFTDTNSFFVCWIQDDLDDETLMFLPDSERVAYTNVKELLSHPTYQYWFSEGTQANLTRVVKKMRQSDPHSQGPSQSKRQRRMRSSQA